MAANMAVNAASNKAAGAAANILKNTETDISGLTEQEVQKRRNDDTGRAAAEQITKSKSKIIKENILTLFNFLNFLIAGLLFLVGAYSNLVFIAIIILNIAIGITQELKAKKLVDELSLLNRPSVCVRRDNKEFEVETSEIVKDDIIVLESGKQICNDAVVVQGSLEVNESLLTGESDAVVKEKGGKLYSGSSVISGKAYAKVTHVGNENYAAKLANEVKKEKKVQSELLGSMRKITKFTSVLIVPLGIALFLEAYMLRGSTVFSSVVSSSAALLGMLPKGLVLLISVSLAAGVIRLAKMKILVQNIYSLETLSRVDTLCLDKTGTITDGKLKVCRVVPVSSEIKNTEALVRSYFASCDDNNATFNALKKEFSGNERDSRKLADKEFGNKKCSNKKNKAGENKAEERLYKPVGKISFSSKRKWGCVSFSEAGSVFVGAPEKIYKSKLPADIEHELNMGRRIVVIGYTEKIWHNKTQLPDTIKPLYFVVLEDNIRPNTRQTLEFFRKEGVEVKVISGDHIKTVSMTAKRSGLENWKNAVDLSELKENIDYDSLCRRYSVFARVTPKQKQELVKALKRQGRRVAMTGDGVNDLLAMREADCSVAVADGSDASRQLAQIVLLDSDFTNLPQAVMEGRKVVNNVTRTASVFFIKTIYSVIVSIMCVLTNTAFPFIPIQITLIDAFIEAYPSFLTIFESDTKRITGSFLKTALLNAMPFGLTAAAMIVGISLSSPFGADQGRTIMYMLLIFISMAAVIKSCVPFNLLRTFICVTMAVGIFAALAVMPSLFEISNVTEAMRNYMITGAALSVVCISVLSVFTGGREQKYSAKKYNVGENTVK